MDTSRLSPISRSNMSSIISSSFYHSTPVASRRNRFNADPFIGEQFSCDVDAWLELDQLATHVTDVTCSGVEEKTAENDAEDWWMVELDAAAAYNAAQPNNDGKVKAVHRMIMRLTELAARMLTGQVLRGLRITSTDRRLTLIATAESVMLSKRKPVTDEMAEVATEELLEPIALKENTNQQHELTKQQEKERAERTAAEVEIDSECDPEDDLCTCRKCRTFME